MESNREKIDEVKKHCYMKGNIMEAIVSVVVPIFNTPMAYLCQCIQSLQQQTLNKIEIILVDDGSCEDIAKLCDIFEAKDARIKVLHLPNGGVSIARNKGIEYANGKWLAFLDSDDWLDVNCLKWAVAIAEEFNCDFLAWNHFYNYEDEKTGKMIEQKRKPITPDTIIRNMDCVEDRMLMELDTIHPEYETKHHSRYVGAIRGVWAKLYLNDKVKSHRIHFSSELKISEDAYFNLCYFQYAERIVMKNVYLNHYRIRSGSAMKKEYTTAVKDNQKILELFYKKLGNKLYQKEFQSCYAHLIGACIARCFQGYFLPISKHMKYQLVLEQIEEMCKMDFYNKAKEYSIFSDIGNKERVVLLLTKYNMSRLLLFLFGIRSKQLKTR